MARAVPRSFYDTSSRRYLAGDEIAAGGEGSIHEVQGEPDWVMKLYSIRDQRLTSERREQLQELRRKIKFMISHAPGVPAGLPDGLDHRYWTWPIERVFTRDGVFSGYVMPKLTGEKGEEFLQLSSGYSWQARLVAARNLAKLVAATHQAGYIIGDLNPRNLFFSQTEPVATQHHRGPATEPVVLPSVTDTDSLQIGGLGGDAILFPCRVQNPEYSAPELINAETLDRTVEQDYFCLAIIVFQLLSLGLHPFSGTTKSSTNQEIRSNIARGRNVLFSDREELTPPRLMIDLEVLPPAVLELFERTFRKGDTVTRARATAEEWDAVLARVLTEGLHVCRTSPNHFYGSHLPECPWCHYAKRVGGDPFNLPAARPSGRPQAPLEIDAAAAGSGIPGPVRTRTVTGPVTAPLTVDGGSDTHFGPLPPDMIPGGDRDREGEGVPEVTTPPPVPPEPEPTADADGPAEPAAEPRWRRLLSPATVLIALTVFVFVLGFVFREPLRQFWTASIQPGIANLLDRGSPGPVTFGTTTANDVCQGACTLTVEVCVDTDPPFDCTGAAAPARPSLLVLYGPDDAIVQHSESSLENRYIRFAQRLRSGRYRIEIDDSNLSANYVRCSPSGNPDINPPGGNSVSVTLTAPRKITFAYCSR